MPRLNPQHDLATTAARQKHPEGSRADWGAANGCGPENGTSTPRGMHVSLIRTAIPQSRAPAEVNCATLLTMHDAVESFLQLSSEHLDAGAGQTPDMDYWDILNKKLRVRRVGTKRVDATTQQGACCSQAPRHLLLRLGHRVVSSSTAVFFKHMRRRGLPVDRYNSILPRKSQFGASGPGLEAPASSRCPTPAPSTIALTHP